MKFREHCILTTIAITGWFFFYLIGISSDYFLEWSFSDQILLTLVTIFGVVPLMAFFIIVLLNRNYIKTGIWFSFYASAPLIILDFITVGIIKGYGINFLVSHWYLTLGYFYVWIIGPLMGYTLQRLKKQF